MTTSSGDGYARFLERRLDVTLFQRAGLVLEPAAAAGLVRAALSLHDRGRAVSVVQATERTAIEHPEHPSLAAAVMHARGVLTRDPGLLIKASNEHGRVWARASAAEDAAVVLAELGEGEGAIEQLVRARDAYQAVAATRDLDRVRARLRMFGVRIRHWSVADRPAFGWQSLTETEHRVVDLAIEGLTNRQIAEQMFLSPHTIAFHLRQVFRKLDISSRVQLAKQANEFAAPSPAAVAR